MIVCPVCEHPQAQGAECEACGKRLVKGPTAADLAVPPIDGLERTAHAPAGAGAERLIGLEPTRHAAASPADDPTPGIEPTHTMPVDVDVQLVPEIEPTASGIPGDVPTALPALVACRYCRTPAVPGEKICARCGMRLPWVGGASEEPEVAGWRCSCGALARGNLCPSCGARTT